MFLIGSCPMFVIHFCPSQNPQTSRILLHLNWPSYLLTFPPHLMWLLCCCELAWLLYYRVHLIIVGFLLRTGGCVLCVGCLRPCHLKSECSLLQQYQQPDLSNVYLSYSSDRITNSVRPTRVSTARGRSAQQHRSARPRPASYCKSSDTS